MVITPCVCPGWPPRPCAHFSYWEPTLLVHTEAYTGLSRSATDSRFHEARVWPFPLKEVDPLGCIFPCKSPSKMLSVFGLIPYFISDIDPPWRRGDWGTGSAAGNYVWVWYQRRTCCIDPEEVCTSGARYRDPLLTVACARIKESPPSASPAFRRDPVTVNLRLAG